MKEARMARNNGPHMELEELEKILDTLPPPDMGTKTRNREEIKRPRKWAVIFLNDDFTPMDFVVDALIQHFHKPVEDAIGVMLNIHHCGEDLVGLFCWEIAEHKSELVMALARELEYPLMVRIEPIEGEDEA